MPEITYTLLSDGTSDKALLPIIDWTIQQCYPTLAIQRQWADLSLLPAPPPTGKLAERIQKAVELYPCDWLFVHRDAEKQTMEERHQEIAEAWRTVEKSYNGIQTVSIIPIRMTEAWLLFDEQAIRTASGNPSGKQRLNLPPVQTLEALPEPKKKLQQLLRDASGLTGRRLQSFKVGRAIQLVADNIIDFKQLQSLTAFADFERSVQQLIES